MAWLLVLLSALVHAMHYCKGDECDSDEDETPSTMYSWVMPGVKSQYRLASTYAVSQAAVAACTNTFV